jgi:uncharacterized protein
MQKSANDVFKFSKSSTFPVIKSELFSWHLNPAAFKRLIPPWEKIQIASEYEELKAGATISFKFSPFIGPIKLSWQAKITQLVKNEFFCDEQLSGPFTLWQHQHLFKDIDESSSSLEDNITYLPRGGTLSKYLLGDLISKKITRLFEFRHEVLKRDLNALKDKPKLNILISGATGFIGSDLTDFLRAGGNTVFRLVRNKSKDYNQKHDILWNPFEKFSFPDKKQRFDAVVHLAGEPIFNSLSWSEDKKKLILESRSKGTENLALALKELDSPPKVFISTSGINYYGYNQADKILDEESPHGSGFLAEVCKAWEAAADIALSNNTRVVKLRLGVVLSPKGGALSLMLPPYKYHFGATVGGKNSLSWISLDDLIYLINFLIHEERITGVVNGVTNHINQENFYSNNDLSSALINKLGASFFRKHPINLPDSILTSTLGEQAKETLLANLKVRSKILSNSNFNFYHRNFSELLDWSLF